MRKSAKVRTNILTSLAKGEFKVGDQLPPESVLIQKFDMSRASLREGLASLVQEGILSRRRGAGTFVAGLSAKKTQVVAMMVPCVHDRWKSMDAITRSIEDEANDNGYSLILCNHDGRPEKALQYVDRLLRDNVSGVIFTPVVHGNALKANMEIVARLEQAVVPFVLIGSIISPQTHSRYSYVCSNGYQGSRLITKHLIQLGHRRLAYMKGLPGVMAAEERFDGFQSALAEAKLQVQPEYIKQLKPVDAEFQGQEEVRELLSVDPPPTAIVCLHDILARNVILELQRLGRRVPDDMAVVGYDDLTFTETFHPPLTTVRSPKCEEGRRAMQLLQSKMDGSSREEKQIYLDCDLVIRESCGAPKELRNEQNEPTGIPQIQVSAD